MPRRHARRARKKSTTIRASGAPLRPQYVRHRDLPLLLPMFPDELAALAHDRLVAMLRRALRLERQRGLRGDWAYDLARHAQLLAAYRTEACSTRRRTGSAAARSFSLPVTRSAKA